MRDCDERKQYNKILESHICRLQTFSGREKRSKTREHYVNTQVDDQPQTNYLYTFLNNHSTGQESRYRLILIQSNPTTYPQNQKGKKHSSSLTGGWFSVKQLYYRNRLKLGIAAMNHARKVWYSAVITPARFGKCTTQMVTQSANRMIPLQTSYDSAVLTKDTEENRGLPIDGDKRKHA